MSTQTYPWPPNGRLTAVPLGAPPDARQVWLPAELTCLTGLPAGLRYAHWAGRSPFPSDPAAVEFYVPPPVQDIGVISRPLDRMTRLKAVQALSSGTDGLGTRLRRLPGRVTLCNAQGVHARSTAELALTLILASLRRIPEFTGAQGRGGGGPRRPRRCTGVRCSSWGTERWAPPWTNSSPLSAAR